MADKEETIHLHKNYNETYCGQDATNLQMTYERDEATCKQCEKALGEILRYRDELNKAAEDLNSRDRTAREEFSAKIEALNEEHSGNLKKLGEEATALIEKRQAFEKENTNVPAEQR